MLELCCEYLSVLCIWLNIIIMASLSFRVNPHCIFCLNMNQPLAGSKRHIWSLSDSKEVRTYQDIVRNCTLNHLAKLAKWMSCVVSTYLYSAFDCMLLLCHVRVWEWIGTLQFAWMSWNSLLKAAAMSEL